MTINKAIQNALEALESAGFPPGGDINDDLAIALTKLQGQFRAVGTASLDEEPTVQPKALSCDQCEMLSINGVACHERGCPNMGATWDSERDEWVKYVKCFECGCDVEKGEACDCQDPVEDDEPEEDDDEDDEDGNDAEQAIEQSRSHNEIVHLSWTEEAFLTLTAESEDNAHTQDEDGNDVYEFWGETDDGSTWRVHLTRE